MDRARLEKARAAFYECHLAPSAIEYRRVWYGDNTAVADRRRDVYARIHLLLQELAGVGDLDARAQSAFRRRL